MKRKWLHELPYLLIALYATKIGQAWRLAEGTDAAHKLLSLMDSLSASFASPLPSFELHDLCIGLLLGAGFRLFIFIKDSEKKKYRKGREYGSARCRALPVVSPTAAIGWADCSSALQLHPLSNGAAGQCEL